MYRSKDVTPAVKKRQDVEIRIIKATVKALLDAGFELNVFDGETHYAMARTWADVKKAIYETDEDYLIAWKEGKRFGWVRFVYGNDGWDVICDYTTNLEPYIGEGTAVQKLIDKLSN